MDSDFFISELLYKLKIGKLSIVEMCELFPEKNQNEAKSVLSNISYPIDLETFKLLQKLFS